MINQVFVKGACQACGGHLEFPAEAAGQTSTCPHCGQVTELRFTHLSGKSSLRWLWVSLAVLGCCFVGAVAIILHSQRFHHLAAIWHLKFARSMSHGSNVVSSMHARSTSPGTNSMDLEKAEPDGPAGPANPPTEQPRPGEVITNSFAVSGGKLVNTPGSSLVNVTGHVRNLSDQQRFGVKVAYSLFDANGRQIGQATDYESVLDPHGDWDFKAMVMESKVFTAKFSDITEAK